MSIKKGSPLLKPVKISTKLAGVIGKGPMPRSQITKKLWAYIKKHNLQHAKYKRCIKLDAKLASIFRPTKGKMPVTVNGKKTQVAIPAGHVYMFDMTKQLYSNKHVETAKIKPNPKSSKASSYEDDEDEDEYEDEDEDEDDYEDEEEDEDEDDYDDEDEDEDEDDYDDEDD